MNISVGLLEFNPLRTVSQSPPKNKIPKPIPANKASSKLTVSFIYLFIFFMNLFIFLLNPIPCKNTTYHQSSHQKTKRPGEIMFIVFIQPNTDYSAQDGRHGNRPAHHSKYSQAIPHASVIALCLQFSFFLSGYDFLKGIPSMWFLFLHAIFLIFENSAKTLFQALPSQYGHLFPIHPILAFLFSPFL